MSLLSDDDDLNDNVHPDPVRYRETADSKLSPMPVEPRIKISSVEFAGAGAHFHTHGEQNSGPRPSEIEVPYEEVPSSSSDPRERSSGFDPSSGLLGYRSLVDNRLVSGVDLAAMVEHPGDKLAARADRQDKDYSADTYGIGTLDDDLLEEITNSYFRPSDHGLQITEWSEPAPHSERSGSQPLFATSPTPNLITAAGPISPEPWTAFAVISRTPTPSSIDLGASDTIDELIEQDDPDCVGDLNVQKDHFLERLMLRVHSIFTTNGFLSRGGNEESASGKQDVFKHDGAIKDVMTPLRLEKGVKRGKDDDGDDDRGRKRRKTRHKLPDPSSPTGKKFACPYFKHDPRRNRPSRACYGPGFVTTARMKAHLYRVHSKPLHCRRCYSTFENEAQLTEHSRSIDCAVGELQSVEGFDKDQEKMLKSRSPMFEAENEEDKWRIIYLILFPDTPLGDLPSPYYHVDDEVVPARSADDSPESPALAQFHAFLRRELPRTVRKRLQTMLESKLGPLEETLKNEVESVVRDCQETLTHSYLKEAGTSTGPSYAPESIHGPSHITQPSSLRKMPPSYDLEADECFVSPAADLDVGTSSRHLMPSTTTYYPCPEHRHIDGVSEAPANSLDSAYFSLAEDINASSFDFAWGLTGFEQTALDKLLETHDGRATEAIDTSIESFYGFNEQQHYTGKGKDVAP
ncbi:hypothetical protein BKA63DRAFT_305477 [Paraphoma chrysanthemicola]|nr:hypothetical protein BKA63DRAFT_305477 [Paraphoma chrysanthemicola]